MHRPRFAVVLAAPSPLTCSGHRSAPDAAAPAALTPPPIRRRRGAHCVRSKNVLLNVALLGGTRTPGRCATPWHDARMSIERAASSITRRSRRRSLVFALQMADEHVDALEEDEPVLAEKASPVNEACYCIFMCCALRRKNGGGGSARRRAAKKRVAARGTRAASPTAAAAAKNLAMPISQRKWKNQLAVC